MAKTKKQTKKDSLNWLPDNLINTELISFGAKKVLNALQSYRLATPAAETNIIIISRDQLTEIAHISARDVIRYTQELEQYNLLIKIAGKKKFANGSNDPNGVASKYYLLEDNWDKELKKIAFNEIVDNRKKLLQIVPIDEDGTANGTEYNNILYNKIESNNIEFDNMLSDNNFDDKVIEVEPSTDNTEDNDQLNNNFINNKKDFNNIKIIDNTMLNDSVSSKQLTDKVTVESETVSSSKCIEVKSNVVNTSIKSDESHQQAPLDTSLFINKDIIEGLHQDLVEARRAHEFYKDHLKLINTAWKKAHSNILTLQDNKVLTFYEALFTLNEETTRFKQNALLTRDEVDGLCEEYKDITDLKTYLAKANQEKDLRKKFFLFRGKTKYIIAEIRLRLYNLKQNSI